MNNKRTPLTFRQLWGDMQGKKQKRYVRDELSRHPVMVEAAERDTKHALELTLLSTNRDFTESGYKWVIKRACGPLDKISVVTYWLELNHAKIGGEHEIYMSSLVMDGLMEAIRTEHRMWAMMSHEMSVIQFHPAKACWLEDSVHPI